MGYAAGLCLDFVLLIGYLFLKTDSLDSGTSRQLRGWQSTLRTLVDKPPIIFLLNVAAKRSGTLL